LVSIKFKDKTKNEYWYNNKWEQYKERIETINILGEKPLIDTVILYYPYGRLFIEDARKKPAEARKIFPWGDALRWIAHDESDEYMCFYLLNRAKTILTIGKH